MDSFELNKIIGAVLGTCRCVLVSSFAAGAIFTPKMPDKMAPVATVVRMPFQL